MRERIYKRFVHTHANSLPFTNVPVKIFDVKITNIFTHFQWRIHKLCKLNRKFMLVVVYFYHSITHSLTHSPFPSFLHTLHTHTHTRLLFGFSVLIVYNFSSIQNAFRFVCSQNGINVFIYFGISSGSLTNFYFEDGSKWMRVILFGVFVRVCSIV